VILTALRSESGSPSFASSAPGAPAARSLVAGHGSHDAWLLAQHLGHRRGLTVIVCAQASDCVRLADEIAWFAPTLRVRLLPDWETLPYDRLSAHQDLVSERLATLAAMLERSLDVLVIAASTAAHRLAPPSYLAGRSFSYVKGQRLDERALRQRLVLAGYQNVSQVVGPGEFSVRGSLIDLFPMGTALPLRIDLFDDEIDSIRTFDPESQRGLYPVDRIELLPGREMPLDDDSRAAFRGRWRERFEGDPTRSIIYRDVGNGIASPGIEYYLPLFFDRPATLFDYLPDAAELALHGPIQDALVAFRRDAQERFRFLGADPERPGLRPDELFLDAEQFFVRSRDWPRSTIRRPDDAADDGTRPPLVTVNRRHQDPVAALRVALERPSGEPLIVIAESPGRVQTLEDFLAEHGIRLPRFDDWQAIAGRLDGDPGAQQSPRAWLGHGPISAGFSVPGQFALVTETELFPSFVRRSRGAREQATRVDQLIRDLSELSAGDPVVHAQHGIGRYQGLVNLDTGEGETEFLQLTYANAATLYVPVSQLHLIGRYSGAPSEEAPLHALGSGQWDKARRRAAGKARDTAAELLALYALRAARQGHPFAFDANDYEAFAEGFGFEETADQNAAIHAVIQDMIAARPMDRLVCGDVGFGKTEVALRAAFVAAAAGRQVAVLTPTTLLAEQHFQTFSDRFSGWPIRIAELSRFRSASQSREIVSALAEGKIDIVIGTHKLLSKDVRIPRLGLVVIDEEHRFGVRQKETLKALRAQVDVLTLTATPIPRTLAMSLEGIRDFSVIATAPQRRLSIRTFVAREGPGIVREALLREIKRGGQAYVLHNEVRTIDNRAARLAELVPEATIRLAHGQMPERELEAVMRDFHQQRFNVLLCSTIIETGIDVPTANTIVIERADRFGLAQLHQLRGRVGRSHHQAYAYLLTPGEDAMTRDAARRLEAIQSMQDLGAGFYLSMHDLEIRGAGEVLGDEQSGAVEEVGFTLYSEMLQRAVRSLRAGEAPDLDFQPFASVTEINLHAPALLPESYCHDVHERLILYKRLADCGDDDQLTLLREELIDRFGRLPEPASRLIDVHRLRLLASAIGLVKVDAGPEQLTLQFSARPLTAPERILAFAQNRKDTTFAGQDRLRIRLAEPEAEKRVQRVREILKALQPDRPGEKSSRAETGRCRPG
jgi:transcription-repair coupling factor (superfamily II helicase)